MTNKILIVDDERSVILQVKTLIDSFGYKSFYIPRAQFLIKRLESESFDLILLDINMPGISGIDALKMLKSNPKFTNIPVIMMTGETNAKSLEECFNYGASDYITKPINELVLKARVKSVIDKQEYLKEIFAKNEELTAQSEEINKQKNIAVAKSEELVKSEHKIKIAHENIKASINYACKIQTAMLPDEAIFENQFSEHCIIFKPRDIVSGDFYWAKKINNTFIYAVADCTGHGVPGAFVSMLGMSLLNEMTIKEEDCIPSIILNDMRMAIKTSLKQTGKEKKSKEGMDVALCVINLNNLQLQFSGAYNSLYIFRDNELKILKADRQPIGVYTKEHDFSNQNFQLQKNDVLYSFSDGYIDQFGEKTKRKFMKKNFEKLLFEIHSLPMKEQKQILEERYYQWKGNLKQLDDIVILCLKI